MLVLLVLFTSVLTGRDVNNKMCTFYFFTLIMQACNLPFMHALELSYADLNLQPRPSACWTAQLLSAFQELRGSELYVRAVQTGRAILMQVLTADLKHRMRGVWRDLDAELVDPNTHNNKLATYHSWFAIPFPRNEHMPMNVPRYFHLDLSKHVMRNISRFRMRAHTLKVEAAAWLEDGSCVCDQCPGEDEHVQNEVHAL